MARSVESSLGAGLPDLEAAGLETKSSARGIGLVLAGHHPLTLCGLSQVFERESDCTVLAVCTDAETLLEAVRRHQPDIVILDLDRNGTFTVLRRIQRDCLSTRVVVLAAASDNTEMVDAVRLGARTVASKELSSEAIVACIRRVHRGEQWLDGHSVSRLVTSLVKSGPSARHVARQLTPRETEIARLAARGVATKDIAARLDVKHGTVKVHLHSIYEKLHVGGRLGLILFAQRHGLA